MKKLKIFIISFVLVLGMKLLQAEVLLPKVFSDNMILQREMVIKIWGKAKSNSIVKIEFANQKVDSKTDAKGFWNVYLKPISASKNPQKMFIYEDGILQKTISNILIGEVWVSGGQSNMAMPVRACYDWEDVKARADYPNLRYFTPPPADDRILDEEQFDSHTNSHWIIAMHNDAGSADAIAFYFAEKLMKELDIPVGIVQTSRGASQMSTWVAKEEIEKVKSFSTDLKNYKEREIAYDYEVELERWEGMAKAAERDGTKVPPKPRKDGQTIPSQVISNQWNVKVAPVAGYTARGFLWYQGEDDSHSYRVETFEEAFTCLINSWRERWGNQKMPFYFIDIGSREVKHNWAPARSKQNDVWRNVPNTAMACSIDCGDKLDPHPRNKAPLGLRLVAIALREVYNKDIKTVYSPRFAKAEIQGNQAKAIFDMDYSTLIVKDNELKGFEIKVDGEWKLPESMKLSGDDSVIVFAKKDEVIEGVRYAWKSWVGDDVCLYNEVGYPAFCFQYEE